MDKSIHFVGIKGVGMASLALMAKQAGCVVTGSDVGEQFITDIPLERAGIVPLLGFSAEHVTNTSLVITTGAHGGYSNPEVISAKEKGIPVVSLAEAIGMCMDGVLFGRQMQGISVAGTHGKTTTTAMIATIFRHAGKDPSFYIGTSDIPSLGTSGFYGSGDVFIVESDEYATEPTQDKRPKFYWQHPKIAIFLNIEHDHPDIYPDIDSMRKVFDDFAHVVSKSGVLIANGDDHNVQRILKEYQGRVITFGFNATNDFVLQHVVMKEGLMYFTLRSHGADLGEFSLRVAGEHNAMNAVAAIIAALEAGLNIEEIRKGIAAFSGTKRRMEYVGSLVSGALLYDDYGHHPTEVSTTLLAFKKMYPDKHIVCIFQPHTYSRTKVLFSQFVHAFSAADYVLLMDIYGSAREARDESVSSRKLVEEIQKIHKNTFLLPTAQDVIQYLGEKAFDEKTVVVTMGAGDVYKISKGLTLKK